MDFIKENLCILSLKYIFNISPTLEIMQTYLICRMLRFICTFMQSSTLIHVFCFIFFLVRMHACVCVCAHMHACVCVILVYVCDCGHTHVRHVYGGQRSEDKCSIPHTLFEMGSRFATVYTRLTIHTLPKIILSSFLILL